MQFNRKKSPGQWALVILTAVSFLFSGNPHKENPYPLCSINYFELTDYAGFPVNCDAFGFIGAAIRPSYLLTENYNRQSRPLFILTGTAVGYTIYYISTPFHSWLGSKVQGIFPSEAETAGNNQAVLYFCFYLGFIVINLLTAYLTVYLFDKLVHCITGAWRHPAWLKYAFFLLLLSNQVTQLFTWTVHTQLFNLFTPVYILYTGTRIALNDISLSRSRWITLLTGTLFLVYGNFLLALPVFLVAGWMRQTGPRRLRPQLVNSIVYTALFLLPLLAWQLILKLLGLELYSDETRNYRQVVWIFDSLQQGPLQFLRDAGTNLTTFALSTGGLVFSFLLMLAIRLLLQKPSGATITPQRPYTVFQQLSLLLTVLSLLFFGFLGYYSDRLTAFFLPLMTLQMAVQVNRYSFDLKWKLALAVIILSWHVYIILQGVPYFYNTFYR